MRVIRSAVRAPSLGPGGGLRSAAVIRQRSTVIAGDLTLPEVHADFRILDETNAPTDPN